MTNPALSDPATPPSPPLAEADVIIIIDRPDRPSSIRRPEPEYH